MLMQNKDNTNITGQNYNMLFKTYQNSKIIIITERKKINVKSITIVNKNINKKMC